MPLCISNYAIQSKCVLCEQHAPFSAAPTHASPRRLYVSNSPAYVPLPYLDGRPIFPNKCPLRSASDKSCIQPVCESDSV